jgi:hypothetical protein
MVGAHLRVAEDHPRIAGEEATAHQLGRDERRRRDERQQIAVAIDEQAIADHEGDHGRDHHEERHRQEERETDRDRLGVVGRHRARQPIDRRARSGERDERAEPHRPAEAHVRQRHEERYERHPGEQMKAERGKADPVEHAGAHHHERGQHRAQPRCPKNTPHAAHERSATALSFSTRTRPFRLGYVDDFD